MSCGSLSPIPKVATKQCRVPVTNTENNNTSYSYIDLDQLISRNQMTQPQPESRNPPLNLVLASATTAVLILGLSAGLCIGFVGIEIGLPFALVGVGVILSVISMSLWLYRKCSRHGYQTIPGYEVSPSQL